MLIYGPFIPLTYAQFQSATSPAKLLSVLAARSAIVLVSTPLGTAIGGPLVGRLGASGTLVASGALTVLLARGRTVPVGRRETWDPSVRGAAAVEPTGRG